MAAKFNYFGTAYTNVQSAFPNGSNDLTEAECVKHLDEAETWVMSMLPARHRQLLTEGVWEVLTGRASVLTADGNEGTTPALAVGLSNIDTTVLKIYKDWPVSAFPGLPGETYQETITTDYSIATDSGVTTVTLVDDLIEGNTIVAYYELTAASEDVSILGYAVREYASYLVARTWYSRNEDERNFRDECYARAKEVMDELLAGKREILSLARIKLIDDWETPAVEGGISSIRMIRG